MPQSESALRVVLIDDHALVRAAIRSVLEDDGIEVVGEAEDGPAGVRLVAEKAPHVAVIDLSMPGKSGIEVTQELAGAAPGTRVLVLTGSVDEHDVKDAIDAGACGYLLKDADPDEITVAVRAAAAGRTMISPRARDKPV